MTPPFAIESERYVLSRSANRKSCVTADGRTVLTSGALYVPPHLSAVSYNTLLIHTLATNPTSVLLREGRLTSFVNRFCEADRAQRQMRSATGLRDT